MVHLEKKLANFSENVLGPNLKNVFGSATARLIQGNIGTEQDYGSRY